MATIETAPALNNQDPFAAQRGADEPAFRSEETNDVTVNEGAALAPPLSPDGIEKGRRSSREWDASKVPPSQFQRRKGSIYSTPSSRDGHVDNHKARDKAFHDKLKEKGWLAKLTGK